MLAGAAGMETSSTRQASETRVRTEIADLQDIRFSSGRQFDRRPETRATQRCRNTISVVSGRGNRLPLVGFCILYSESLSSLLLSNLIRVPHY